MIVLKQGQSKLERESRILKFIRLNELQLTLRKKYSFSRKFSASSVSSAVKVFTLRIKMQVVLVDENRRKEEGKKDRLVSS